MSEQRDEPIYLTAAGRRRLERRLEEYEAGVADLTPPPVEESDPEDRGDAAERLMEEDDLTPVQDRLAATRDLLRRARPMPEGPDDGVVRLGSTVRVRDADGAGDEFTIVDPAELVDGEGGVAADSPLGRALMGRRAGSQVTFEPPSGHRTLTILSVQPYREANNR